LLMPNCVRVELSLDRLRGGTEACLSGIQPIGCAKPGEALVWKARTCRHDA
jgi:hypothetical protein